MKHAKEVSRRHTLRSLGQWAVLAASIPLLAACGKKSPTATAVPEGATVLALGDSLTQGVGASANQSYPALLAERTGWKVVNAGVSGETSSQIAARLPALLDQHHPSLVILCAGGNDWLRRINPATAQGELEQMLALCKDKAVPVLLVAVPQLSLSAALTGSMHDHPVYESVARSAKVPLLADAWSGVLSDASLRADQVHANAQGYARFTELLVAQLQKSGFLRT